MIRTKQKAPVKSRGRPKILEPATKPTHFTQSEMRDTIRRVGRPPSGKIMFTMRIDPEIVAKFKATGKGWQARMNEALRAASEEIK